MRPLLVQGWRFYDWLFLQQVFVFFKKNFCRIYLTLPVFAEFGNLLLLVASRNQIVVDNITSHAQHIYSLVRDGRNIVAVDFDSVTDRIFWSDTTQDKIWTAYQNGTDRKVVSLSWNADIGRMSRLHGAPVCVCVHFFTCTAAKFFTDVHEVHRC